MQLRHLEWRAGPDDTSIAVYPVVETPKEGKPELPQGGKWDVDVVDAQRSDRDPVYGRKTDPPLQQHVEGATNNPAMQDLPAQSVPPEKANIADSYDFYPTTGTPADAKRYDRIRLTWRFETNLVCLDTDPPTVLGHFTWSQSMVWTSAGGWEAGGDFPTLGTWESGPSPHYDELVGGADKPFDHPKAK